MFLDDLLILRLTPAEFHDFIEFGYVAIIYTNNIDKVSTFKGGKIFRFGVFCDKCERTYIKPIKKQYFKANEGKEFTKLYNKLDNSDNYRKYDNNQIGEPIIDPDATSRKRL